MAPQSCDLMGYSFVLGGIYSATAVLIASSLLVYGALLATQRMLDKGQWVTLIACLVFGGMTLAFHSETFLKWKAPIVNWIFASAFLASQYIGQKPFIQRMLEQAVALPDPVWLRLNWAWVVFFVFCGAANLYVAFHFAYWWVDFKVFGSLAMTLLFLLGQGIYLARYLSTQKPQE